MRREKEGRDQCERWDLGEPKVREDHAEGFGGGGGGGGGEKMERKRSGAGVCFPSGWWWATAASINTCLHGSHISCFTPHPSTGPHKLRTP